MHFVTRYIYFPLMRREKLGNKIFASFLCFMFVLVWHGNHDYICIWAMLNFVGLTMEMIFKYYYNNVKHKKSIKNIASGWKRRFGCIIATPLLAMSAMSNFYFFAGTEVGNIFVKKFFQSTYCFTPCLLLLIFCFLFADDTQTNLIILFFLYNCCQVSVQLKDIKM